MKIYQNMCCEACTNKITYWPRAQRHLQSNIDFSPLSALACQWLDLEIIPQLEQGTASFTTNQYTMHVAMVRLTYRLYQSQSRLLPCFINLLAIIDIMPTPAIVSCNDSGREYLRVQKGSSSSCETLRGRPISWAKLAHYTVEKDGRPTLVFLKAAVGRLAELAISANTAASSLASSSKRLARNHLSMFIEAMSSSTLTLSRLRLVMVWTFNV